MRIYVRVLIGPLKGYVYLAKEKDGYYEADTEFGVITYSEKEIQKIGYRIMENSSLPGNAGRK